MGDAGRLIARVSRLWAILGGVVLLGVMLMTVVSVAMRYTLGSPILGDFELVELGTAVAAFAFLPYAQLTRGNVAVDVFTTRAPVRVQAALTALGSLALALIAALLVWRMALGGHDFYRYNEVTTNIGVPRWWVFPPILLSLALLVLTSLQTLAEDLRTLREGGPT